MAPVVTKKHIEIYATKDGRAPFLEWLESLDNTTNLNPEAETVARENNSVNLKDYLSR